MLSLNNDIEFYASNLRHQKKLNTGLKNIELNQENKQPWAENGRNTSLDKPTNFANRPRKRAGFDVS